MKSILIGQVTSCDETRTRIASGPARITGCSRQGNSRTVGVPFPCRFLLFLLVGAFISSVAFPQNFSLTIQFSGPDPGTVTVSPPVLDCGNPAGCVFSIPSGTFLTLSASPPVSAGPPGVFSAGTGSAAGCETTTCSFTMNSDSSIIATFDPSQGPFPVVSVTFLGEGSGGVSVDTNLCFSGEPQCAISYVSGSLVTLVADPQPGSTFDGFFGECFSSSLTCSFTITSDSVVEAIFSQGSSEGLVRFMLTKGGAGSGRVVSNPPGIDCGTDCSTNFEQGTQLTLTATPDAGSSFGGWQGDEDCAASMVLDFDTNCTAIFNLQEEQVFYLPM